MAKKQKREIIENMTFDSAAYAQDVYVQSERMLKRNGIGILLGLVSSGMGFLNYVSAGTAFGNAIAVPVIIIWIASALAAYIIGCAGNYKTVLSLAWRMGTIGWFIMPFLLLALWLCMVTMFITLLVLVYLPWVFILIVRRQVRADMAAAELYLSYCKPVQQ